MKKILVSILLLIFAVSSVSALNTTTTTSYSIVPPTYIPYEYVLAYVVFGFICWFLMRYMPDLEVLFSFAAILFFGLAVNYAPYMAVVKTFETVDTSGTANIVYTQMVTPQPIFQDVLGALFLFSIIVLLYVWKLRDADKKLDAKRPQDNTKI